MTRHWLALCLALGFWTAGVAQAQAIYRIDLDIHTTDADDKDDSDTVVVEIVSRANRSDLLARGEFGKGKKWDNNSSTETNGAYVHLDLRRPMDFQERFQYDVIISHTDGSKGWHFYVAEITGLAGDGVTRFMIRPTSKPTSAFWLGKNGGLFRTDHHGDSVTFPMVEY